MVDAEGAESEEVLPQVKPKASCWSPDKESCNNIFNSSSIAGSYTSKPVWGESTDGSKISAISPEAFVVGQNGVTREFGWEKDITDQSFAFKNWT